MLARFSRHACSPVCMQTSSCSISLRIHRYAIIPSRSAAADHHGLRSATREIGSSFGQIPSKIVSSSLPTTLQHRLLSCSTTRCSSREPQSKNTSIQRLLNSSTCLCSSRITIQQSSRPYHHIPCLHFRTTRHLQGSEKSSSTTRELIAPNFFIFTKYMYKQTIMLYIIMAVNLIVFVMYNMGEWGFLPEWIKDHAPTQKWMNQHFAISLQESIYDHRYYTILTSNFAHRDGRHFLLNMFMLFMFGKYFQNALGGPRLLTLYLLGGGVSNLCFLLQQYINYRHSKKVTDPLMERFILNNVVGSSGSVSGIVMASVAMFPSTSLLLFGLLPSAPAPLCLILYLAFESTELYRHGLTHPLSHSHFAGAFVGLVFYLVTRRVRWH